MDQHCFLMRHRNRPRVAIDEVQKAPELFHRNAARKLATLVAKGIAAKLDFEGLP